jgi:hypothetical protein
MARRDLANFTTVTDVVADQTGLEVAAAVADFGNEIIDASQKAKVQESLSQARLDLNKLDTEFKIKNEGNPFDAKAIEDYKLQRSKLMSSYENNIGMLWTRDFQEKSKALATDSDLGLQVWGYKQASENTLNSIARMRESRKQLMYQHGLEWGKTGQGDLDAILDSEAFIQQLTEYATSENSTGSETLLTATEDIASEDAASFLAAGGAENPSRAKALLNSGYLDEILDVETRVKLEDNFTRKIEAERKRAVAAAEKALKLRADDPYTYFEMSGLSLDDNVEAQSRLTGDPSSASVMGSKTAKALANQFNSVKDVSQFEELYGQIESEYGEYAPNALNDLSKAGLNNNKRIAATLIEKNPSPTNTDTLQALFEISNMKDPSGKEIDVQQAAKNYLLSKGSVDTVKEVNEEALKQASEWIEVQVSGKANAGDVQFINNTVKDLAAYYTVKGYTEEQAATKATEWLTDGSVILSTNGHKYMLPESILSSDGLIQTPVKDIVDKKLENIDPENVFFMEQTVGNVLSKQNYVETIKSSGGWINSRDGKSLLLVDGDGLFVFDSKGENIKIDVQELEIENRKQILKNMSFQEKIDYYGREVEPYLRDTDGNF